MLPCPFPNFHCFPSWGGLPGPKSQLDPIGLVSCLLDPPGTQPAEVSCTLSPMLYQKAQGSVSLPKEAWMTWETLSSTWGRDSTETVEVSKLLCPELSCQAQGSVFLPKEFSQCQEQPANIRDNNMATDSIRTRSMGARAIWHHQRPAVLV